MKIISSFQGMCGLRISPDDAATENGVLVRDVAEYVADTYGFQNKPDTAAIANAAVIQEYAFHGGRISIDKQEYAIGQLTYIYGGLIVLAKDTHIAAMIADQIMKDLDAKFGYKMANSIRGKYYLSDLVVEFDDAVGARVNALTTIEGILNRDIPRADAPFDLKRIAFGAQELQPHTIGSLLDTIPRQDFVLERRAGESHSSNRYYSRAPTTTREHERILAEIERVFRD